MNYSITNPSWLTASSKSRTVTTSTKTITFKINFGADKLSPNSYVSSIDFKNTINDQGNTIRVVTVNPKDYKSHGPSVSYR